MCVFYVRHKGVFLQSADCEEDMRDDFRMIRMVAVLLGSFFLLSGCGGGQKDSLAELELTEPSGTEEDSETQEEFCEEEEETFAYVYVCGAVHSPGVYKLRSDARVFEAVKLAGGLTEEAAGEYVNQAETVTDGGRIYVPTQEEALEYGTGVAETGITSGTDGKKQGKININTAGKEELMQLTGIGEAKAQSILDYREEHGRFTSTEELMQIEGIKEGVFNKIKEDITI